MNTKIIVAGLICILLFSLMAGTASAEDSVKLCGYITEDNGNPISDCLVSVKYGDQKGFFFENTQTGKNGYYELTVPYYSSYDFFVESRRIGGDNLYNFIPRKKYIEIQRSAIVQTDFILKPAVNIIIHAYDNEGNILRNKDFHEATLGEVYATNPDGLPHYAVYQPIRDSYSESLPKNIFLDMTMPAFITLPKTPYRIHFLWEVPEFGKVMLFADNEGRGYSIDKKGGQLVLNLNYEAAKSRVAMLKRDLDLLKSEGLVISSTVAKGLEQGQEHLRIAESHILQSPSPDLRAGAQELNLSLKYSMLAHEQLYLEKAKADIEKYRKGDAKIRVFDEAGKPLSDCSFVFRQISHDFIFSARPHDSKYSALLKQAGINSVAFNADKYGEIEPEPGRFNWAYTDSQANVQMREGFTPLGNLGWLFFHGWGHDTAEAFLPQYLGNMSFSQLKDAVYRHMYAIVDRYKGKVDIWDALYEICGAWSNELNLTWRQRFEVFKAAASAVKMANPQSKVFCKGLASLYNHFMSWSVYEPISLDAKADWVPLLEFLDEAQSQGIPFDIIGLEIPRGDVELYQTGSPNIHPALDLVSLSTLLDQYAKFNRPIMLLDYHAPSTQITGGCWWHRPWDEQTQAEYATAVYTLVFSKPLAKGIDWGTGIADDVSGKAGGLTCGLLAADLEPKPVYFTLKNLINSWMTKGEGKTDSEGKFKFRGFAGDYEVTLEATNGQSFRTLINVSEQQTNEITIEFPLTVPQEPHLKPSSEPEVEPSPKAAAIPGKQQPAVTPTTEEVPSSAGNIILLITGAIGGILVVGLLTVFMVRKRTH